MSSFVNIDNKKKDLILRKNPLQGLDNTTIRLDDASTVKQKVNIY